MIKQLITDVDGILTDGGMYYTLEGKIMKKFAPHDSDGVKLLRKHGIEVYGISADWRGFEISKKRFDDMGVSLNLVSGKDRAKYIKENFGFEHTAFVGDGFEDVQSLLNSKVGYAPSNACKHAKDAADFIIDTPGGSGVLLEVAIHIIEFVNGEKIENGQNI
jgi:3-deoxy-D-manno-octulosonate 8-phosphate phosphatase (KDO 8-P phosphatase)